MSAQRYYCSGCKQTRHDTRQYILLSTYQKLYFCVKCAGKMTNIKPATQIRVPSRFNKE